jgi:surface polysaccharide O-acyltransferase-like enzyme
MSIAWFMLFKELTSSYKDNSRYHRILVRVSNSCFGIYLIHIFVMRSLLWRWSLLQETNGIVQILLTTVLTFMVSLFVTWIISYMPFAQYIIGYKNKK